LARGGFIVILFCDEQLHFSTAGLSGFCPARTGIVCQVTSGLLVKLCFVVGFYRSGSRLLSTTDKNRQHEQQEHAKPITHSNASIIPHCRNVESTCAAGWCDRGRNSWVISGYFLAVGGGLHCFVKEPMLEVSLKTGQRASCVRSAKQKRWQELFYKVQRQSAKV